MEIIRYYKGIIKLTLITKSSTSKTCAYKVLENGYENIGFGKGIIHIIPFRLCHKNQKEENNKMPTPKNNKPKVS